MRLGGPFGEVNYLLWVLLAGLGAFVAVIEARLWRYFVGWLAFGALIAGGLLTTRLSPFTFAGGDYYMEGVIAAAAGGLLLVGYIPAALYMFVRRKISGRPS